MFSPSTILSLFILASILEWKQEYGKEKIIEFSAKKYTFSLTNSFFAEKKRMRWTAKWRYSSSTADVVCHSCDRLKDKMSALRLQMKQLQAENDRLWLLVNLNQGDPSRDFNMFYASWVWWKLPVMYLPRPNISWGRRMSGWMRGHDHGTPKILCYDLNLSTNY